MDMHEVASKVQTLVALRHFVAAFDAGQVASKPVQLRITPDAVVDTPYAFKFTADDTTVRSEFTDLVGGQHCTLGCDPAKDGSDSLNFWLVRGTGETADVQQTIARLTYTHKNPKTKEGQSVVVDVAPGVDRMMMILICIGLLDEGFEDEHTQQ
ncbi:hypothetical protein AM588_10003613 [Phytophthora nicotianae]|uniref:Uncharacterized protein n=1 Tax=Phytophthora nicotianae TaxID=4792 RepID=A0A0W8D5B9_PHYNI|nr:hypothetical protein AM588_10003613 [Phytophthora nicotianae]